jgi:hypothetical protein
MSKNSIAFILFINITIASTLHADEYQKDYRPLINSINQTLIDSYVFPEIAPKYAARLDLCLKENCLAEASDDQQVAEKLSGLLNSVHIDKHLNVFAPGARKNKMRRRMVKKSSQDANKNYDTGIVKQEILENNIGYLKINFFPGSPQSIAATYEAMKKLKDTDAIVFDILDHRGGSPENISEISNFLFQQPTHMVTTRSPHVNNGQPTPHMSEPNEFSEYFKDKPIYLLTSERSASAAEHFAMAMKATGRAILIGEKTGGYGHWGGIAELTDGFSMFIPSGRTYHPINKLGWEGIGITPDILIDEEKSLDSAFQRIRTHL